MNSIVRNIVYAILLIMLLPLVPKVTALISSIYTRYMDQRVAVAVIPIKGMLIDSATPVKQIHTYFKDPTIKAILLKIECMGTTSATGQSIFHEISLMKAEYPKPVIALTENICASGGYYIACAADYIIAAPAALVGSIGVRFPSLAQFQLHELLEYHHIKYDPLTAGEYKNAGDLFANRSPEHKKMLQSLLDDTYDQFVEDVAQSRKLSPAHASEWANGRIFTGRQAHKLGLIDQTGSVSDAIKALKERALIEGEIRWIHPASPGGLMRWLTGDGQEDDKGVLSCVVNACCGIVEERYGMQAPQ